MGDRGLSGLRARFDRDATVSKHPGLRPEAIATPGSKNLRHPTDLGHPTDDASTLLNPPSASCTVIGQAAPQHPPSERK